MLYFAGFDMLQFRVNRRLYENGEAGKRSWSTPDLVGGPCRESEEGAPQKLIKLSSENAKALDNSLGSSTSFYTLSFHVFIAVMSNLNVVRLQTPSPEGIQFIL